jgi:formate dehydrogenase (coenzyme F420) beta subunit
MVNSGGFVVNKIWSLETHADPLGKLREFFTKIWLETGLAGMIVTMVESNEAKTTPRYITSVELLNEVNPFHPLMEINIARLIPELLANHPFEKIGAILRPCELRALIEMTKHSSLKIDNLFTICVDCLGTFPADEYQWRLDRISSSYPDQGININNSSDELAHEALKFARQGGIVPYRYRPACQVCMSPEAKLADINIHILGLPVRQQILVSLNDPALATCINIRPLTDSEADHDLMLQHERIVAKKIEQDQRTMERINQGLGELLPENVDTVINQLESCGDCQKCMDVCPICSLDRPTRYSDGHYDRSDVVRWLVSCAGCGMCEQSCPRNLPLYAIFTHIRQQLDQELDFVPGRSIRDPLLLS